ncbi:MAG: hypothetical protein JJ896_05940 [Rhodothermales bacterium]|nr:hypothetical protein [Rhodothermales bacterium]MBO6779173.1 hypothetical protein [Rhodothermales bacterium]
MLVFLLVIVPIVFTMAVWVVVSFYRIMRPEEPQIPVDPGMFDLLLEPRREPALIGAKAIRESGRRQNRERSLSSPYDYLDGHSDGFPEAWWEDVLARRN